MNVKFDICSKPFAFPNKICAIEMTVKQLERWTIHLEPDSLDVLADTELTQYLMTSWRLGFRKKGGGVMMEVVFKRRLMNEILTTYLPSALLILITYSTTFYHDFYFEAAVTVNLTTMLVMTTIFISVMEKLPPTSYVKLVDVWLIMGQLIPFLEVVLLTAMERLRNESDR